MEGRSAGLSEAGEGHADGEPLFVVVQGNALLLPEGDVHLQALIIGNVSGTEFFREFFFGPFRQLVDVAAVVAVGMIMKDAIAQILATANFNAVEIQLQDEDIAKVRSNWAEWKDGEPVNGNENNVAQDKGGCKCGKCGGGQEEAIVPEVV